MVVAAGSSLLLLLILLLLLLLATVVVDGAVADVAVAVAVVAVAVGGVSSMFGAVVVVGGSWVEAVGGAGDEGCVVVAAAATVAEEFSSCNASSSPELLSRAHSMGVENSASCSAGRFSSTEAADDDISSVSASTEGDIIAASSSLPTIGREHSSSSSWRSPRPPSPHPRLCWETPPPKRQRLRSPGSVKGGEKDAQTMNGRHEHGDIEIFDGF